MQPQVVKVFISYSHDSRKHADQVLAFADKLRGDGIDAVLDQYEPSPQEGWPRWMEKQIRESNYVLMICTESYYQRVISEEKAGVGLGVRWEGNIIYNQLYAGGSVSNKFIPVIFNHDDSKYIPLPEQSFTFYCIPEDYEALYRRLTYQPLIKKPKLGKQRTLPPRKHQELDDAASTSQVQTKIFIKSGIDISHNLPQPHYERFIGREAELKRIIEILKPYPSSQHALVTIDGVGGVGKSALALEVANHFLHGFNGLPPEEHFNVIVWTSAKPNELLGDGLMKRHRLLHNVDDIYKSISLVLQLEHFKYASEDEKPELVRQALTQYRTLIIVDNLETVDDEAVIEFLHDLPAPTKAIVTTRHRIDVAYPIRLKGMSEYEAFTLIEDESKKHNATLTNTQKQKLYQRTGGIPAAIVWSLAQIGFGYNIEAVLTRLSDPDSEIAKFCFETTMSIIRGTNSHRMLMALAYLDGIANRHQIGVVAGLPKLDRDEGLVTLEKLSLVNKKGEIFELLPLTLLYSKFELFRKARLTEETEFDESHRNDWTKFLANLNFEDIYSETVSENRLKSSLEKFDVFLAHNNRDKPQVEAISNQLKRRGYKPWLDKEQIPPGRWFQDVIQQAISDVKSAAIFIGQSGLGKWQVAELKVFISRCVEAGIPVIPVLLPGVKDVPKDLLFLHELNWVRFTKSVNDTEALDNLEWGITGKHPKRGA